VSAKLPLIAPGASAGKTVVSQIMFDPVEFLEGEANHGRTTTQFYVRLGLMAPYGISFNRVELRFESGLSVFRARFVPPDLVEADVPLIDHWAADAAKPYVTRSPAFLVDGYETDQAGGEGEPCLTLPVALSALEAVDPEAFRGRVVFKIVD
jgi:hypothetical protein